MKTAIVFGSTGLIGKELVQQLVEHRSFEIIKVFNRKEQTYNSPKIQQFIADFDKIENLKSEISGDVIFICLGTTIKKAGSVKNFRRVDLEYVLKIARIAKENGVKAVSVISSMGVRQSKNYYRNTKFEMEKGIKDLNFTKFYIVRPSLLLGKRNEVRLLEKMYAGLMIALRFIIPEKWKAIKDKQVAKSMIYLVINDLPSGIYENDKLLKMGN